MTASSQVYEGNVPTPSAPHKRGCLFTALRLLKWSAIVLVALIVLGVIYQMLASELDKRGYAPRGQLYTVNGHQMHMICMGEGSPTVVLEGGYYASALWWLRVQDQLAPHTQVCAYDRAGQGWSEPAPGMGDPEQIVTELHALLQEADISAPVVLAGHSAGGVYIRIYAAHYPDEVAGLVLVDTALLIPKHFTVEEWESWKADNDLTQGLLLASTRLGLMRLLMPGAFSSWGYPPDTSDELAALRTTMQTFDTDYAERYAYRIELNEDSAAAEDLGAIPLIALWATDGLTLSEADRALLPALHAEVASYSRNGVSRDVVGADHGSILGNEVYAQQVTDSILEVIAAAETGQSLSQ
ncbi:MAG: alpha/beta hydrolase [Anaerolineae bacterium]|nr:alpha/beta hydrolase [Anaerolineae bacterium]